MDIIIRNAHIINEGKILVADVWITGKRIEKIAPIIGLPIGKNYREINAQGLHLMPGVIDGHVHFREPGLTCKGTIFSESMAAVAGGITSYMDMPNTLPNTLTSELLEEKYFIASQKSYANYSFFMGITKNNLEEVLKTNTEMVCGISDDGLYFDNKEGRLANAPSFLEKLFSRVNTLVALHCENDALIKKNTVRYREIYGDDIPFSYHAAIRSVKACLLATETVIDIAKKHDTHLHLLHLSTHAEASLLDNKIPATQKRITAEACIPHLVFSDRDYELLGNQIKWNPAVKTEKDRTGLLRSLIADRLDMIATDHAPHTIEEKNGNYFQVRPGGPLVQHALPAMLELYHRGEISLEKIVEKMSHRIADIYRIRERGYIREGYYADIALLNMNHPWKVTPHNLLYQCNWSPFMGRVFRSCITHTFVNGNLVYANGKMLDETRGERLKFEKNR